MHFRTTLGGKQDAVVLKLTPNLNTVLFSSYLGGAEDDAGFVLDINPVDGNIYVAGGTSSANFPGATNAYGNAIDGYVSVIANNGSTLIQIKIFWNQLPWILSMVFNSIPKDSLISWVSHWVPGR